MRLFGIVLNEFFELYHNGFNVFHLSLSDFSDWFFHDRRIRSREGQHKFWTENLKDIQQALNARNNQGLQPLSDSFVAFSVLSRDFFKALLL